MLIDPQFDAGLIQRYDISGPRYTSYPTAPQFRDDFGEAAFREQARLSNEASPRRDLSLYLHLPYCSSPCFYCGCTRLITHNAATVDAYLSRLCREIELAAPLFDRDRPIVQLHLGGGTPNLLDTAQLHRLMRTIAANFTLSAGAEREFGIEVDPRHADPDSIRAMAELGFNRISIGVQDFDERVQAAVNRRQSFEQVRELIEAARRNGFRSLNLDLIYGLPLQTPASFEKTLDAVLALRPDRIATYSYAHLPRLFKAQRRITAIDVPNATSKLALFETTLRKLTAGGYHYIGMDHFALRTDDLVVAQEDGSLQRNFQGYSTHAECDLIGLGLSAIGKVGNSYTQNTKVLSAYEAAIDAGRLPIVRGIVASADDVIRRELIGELMCNGTVIIPVFESRHGIDFSSYFAAEQARLAELANDDLIVVTSDRLHVTARGRLLLRIIAMAFDRYLPRNTQVENYSKAI